MADCDLATVEILRTLEEELLQPEVRKDQGRLRELLADDFREFGSSGLVYSKREIMEALAVEGTTEFVVQDFAVEPIGEDSMLVTYRVRRTEGGMNVRESLRSSIWVRRGGEWRMMFHQGTKVATR